MGIMKTNFYGKLIAMALVMLPFVANAEAPCASGPQKDPMRPYLDLIQNTK